MKENCIIVHTLIKAAGRYLVIKRSKEENVYPNYWDIPGGLALSGELPKQAVIRETKEEVNLDIVPTKIIHEDSCFDKEKDKVFIRLVYLCDLNNGIANLVLDEKEHSEYRLISSLDEIKGELIVPFLYEIFSDI